MSKLPDSFLLLTHEGIFRTTIQVESVYNIDKLLAKFTLEKMLVLTQVAEHSFGLLHEVIWTSDPPRRMCVLEITQGQLVLQTHYRHVTVGDQTWVSPCFLVGENSFQLRCVWQFNLWREAGLQLFLGLNPLARTVQFWVHYQGQIYRPPLGNIFEATCQLCLGHNDKAYAKMFPGVGKQPDNISLNHAIALLGDSYWNADTFNGPRDLPVLAQLIRFDSTKQDLPMLPPINVELITKCSVAANKDLAQITNRILQYANPA